MEQPSIKTRPSRVTPDSARHRPRPQGEAHVSGAYPFNGESLRVRCLLAEGAGALCGTMCFEPELSSGDLRSMVDLNPCARERLATLDDGRRFAFRVSWTKGSTLRVRGRFVDDTEGMV